MGFYELIIEETKISNKKYKNIIVNKLFVFSREDNIKCIEEKNPDNLHINIYVVKNSVEVIINGISFEVLEYIKKEKALFIEPAEYIFLPNGIKDENKKMLKIRKVMGRELPFLVGYRRVQKEMDDILYDRDDIVMYFHYYRPPKNIIDHFIKRLIWYPRMLRKSEDEYDVNHIIVQHLGDLARKLNPDKTVLHLLDIWNFIKHSGIRNSSYVNNMRLKGLKNCKYIIAISEFTKQEAVEKLGIDEDRITVIKCGVNRNVFHPVNLIHPIVFANPDTFNILHVGTEGGRKDFITLLHALKEVIKYNPDIILYRVGKPEYKKEIKKMGLKSKIKYISEIDDEDLNILYNSVDLFISPSSYEGFGLSIMEALSCGTPVICSDIPVYKELYKNCVTYFPVNNYIELSERILKFWNNINRIPKSKGIFLAQNNTWEKFANQYFNYIKQRFA